VHALSIHLWQSAALLHHRHGRYTRKLIFWTLEVDNLDHCETAAAAQPQVRLALLQMSGVAGVGYLRFDFGWFALLSRSLKHQAGWVCAQDCGT